MTEKTGATPGEELSTRSLTLCSMHVIFSRRFLRIGESTGSNPVSQTVHFTSYQ